MTELTKLTIVKNGAYNNINLKEAEDVNVNGIKIKVPKLANHYVIVKKKFVNGREKDFSKGGRSWKSYSVLAEYEGVDVGFFLNAAEHDIFSLVGGVGDMVRISGTLVDGTKGQYLKLNFTKEE